MEHSLCARLHGWVYPWYDEGPSSLLAVIKLRGVGGGVSVKSEREVRRKRISRGLMSSCATQRNEGRIGASPRAPRSHQ